MAKNAVEEYVYEMRDKCYSNYEKYITGTIRLSCLTFDAFKDHWSHLLNQYFMFHSLSFMAAQISQLKYQELSYSPCGCVLLIPRR